MLDYLSMSPYWSESDFKAVTHGPLSLNGSSAWEPEWLIEGFLQKESLNFLGGVQKVGKSLLRSHLLVCSVTGRPALGCYKTNVIGKALLLAGEERREAEEARLRKAAAGLGLDADELPIYVMEQRGWFFDPNDEAAMREFETFVITNDFRFVVIDALSNWHTRDENVAAQMAPLMTRIRMMIEGFTILLVHHLGKPQEFDKDKAVGHLLRGSSVLAAAYDNLVIMKNKQGTGRRHKRLTFDTRYSEGLDDIDIELEMDKESYTWLYDGSKKEQEEAAHAFMSGGLLKRNELARSLKLSNGQTDRILQRLAEKGLAKKTLTGWISIDGP